MKWPMPLLLVTVFLNIAGFSLILPLLPFYGNLFGASSFEAVSYTHLRAHETVLDLVCRLLLEKKNSNVVMFTC